MVPTTRPCLLAGIEVPLQPPDFHRVAAHDLLAILIADCRDDVADGTGAVAENIAWMHPKNPLGLSLELLRRDFWAEAAKPQ